nr:unnamed protein product [Callosobruchus analis]
MKRFFYFRYLASGCTFTDLYYTYRLGLATISIIARDVSLAIWNVLRLECLPASTKQEWKNIALDFYNKWNFPNCIGCIDGKHIRIKCPKKTGSTFFNYKSYFSIVLQGIADANNKFIAVEVGAYDRQSDGRTFSDSNIYQRLEAKTLNIPGNENIPSTNIPAPYVLLGDDACPLKTYLLKPYSRQRLGIEERIFNYRLSRARRCVECAFGILVAKWRCLKTELQIAPDKVDIIVKCVCLLHNIIIDMEGLSSLDIPAMGLEAEHNPVSRRYNNYGRSANDAVSPAGEVPFQYNLI